MNAEEERRIAAWSKEADEILASVRKYEDEHPTGAICLYPLLTVMESHDFTPTQHGQDKSMSAAFHERTQRCLDASHILCREVEVEHREGTHHQCLPAEHGHSAEDVRRAQAYLDGGHDGADIDVLTYLDETNQGIPSTDRPHLCGNEKAHIEHTWVTSQDGDREWCPGRISIDPHTNCQEGYCDPWQQGRATDPCPPSGLLQRLPRTIEVPGIRVEYGPQSEREKAFFAPKPEPLSLEQRVAILEGAVRNLMGRPDAFDVIGDRMAPGR